MPNNRVPRCEIFDVSLQTGEVYDNPFIDVEVKAKFKGPRGRKLAVVGFYDGVDEQGRSTWKVRAAFDATGTWNYEVTSSPAEGASKGRRPNDDLVASGSVEVVDSTSHGFIRPSREHTGYFVFDDGTPFYPMGDTAYQMCVWPEADQDAYLDLRAGQKFNFIRMHVAPWHMPEMGYTSPSTDILPWGGTHEKPEFTVLNLDLFRKVEAAINRVTRRGMLVELIVENVHNKSFHKLWEAGELGPQEARYLSYIASRFAAYTGIFVWTAANEFTCYPDGSEEGAKRRVSEDQRPFRWAKWVGRILHRVDPFQHPTTTHPHTYVTEHMGDLFGDSKDIDVISHQYDGDLTDGSGIEVPIVGQRTYKKPIINTESGYESLGLGLPNAATGAQPVDKCRKAAWRIFVAGAAGYADGYEGSWGYSGPQTIFLGAIMPLTFSEHVHTRTHLYEFVTQKTRYWKMSPHDDKIKAGSSPDVHCLADPGTEYVLYFPQPGRATLDLRECRGPLDAEWLNPKTGEYTRVPACGGGASIEFVTSLPDDSVLHLRAPDRW